MDDPERIHKLKQLLHDAIELAEEGWAYASYEQQDTFDVQGQIQTLKQDLGRL